MENQKYTPRDIKVTSIFLDLENYRFKPQTDQVSAIQTMLQGKDGEKLYRLAKDIMENGLNPSEKLIVVQNEEEPGFGTTYTVVEGNRRVAALKLMAIPELIGSEVSKNLKQKFVKLHQQFKDDLVSVVPCVIAPDKQSANLWIGRKHGLGSQGESTEMWDSTMRQRFDQATKGEKSSVLQALDFLRNSTKASIEDMLLFEKMENTNLARLLDDPYVRDRIGLARRNKELYSTRERSDVETMLLSIIRDISRDDFKVADIYNKDLRKSYIDNLCVQANIPDTPPVEEWKVDPTPKQDSSTTQSTKADKEVAKGTRKQRERTSLIPSGIELSIPPEYARAYDVFCELKTLSARKYPNTVAVMFRVFLELSVGAYVESSGMLPEGQLTSNGDGTPNLMGRVNQVINDLMQHGLINKDLQKGIKSELSNRNSPLSIETLNAYVHSPNFFPTYISLLSGWDNVQPFFLILWRKVNDRQTNKES